MNSSYGDKSSWIVKIIRLLDDLCDLLTDYEYGNTSQFEIIKTETAIYELADEYFSRLLPSLNEFFDYIHTALRYNKPLEEHEIEIYLQDINSTLNYRPGYIQYYPDFTDDQTKYQYEVASSQNLQRLRTEREYINQMIDTEYFDEEESRKISIMTRKEKLANAKERKDNIINDIIQFMKGQTYPINTELLYHKVPGATHQLIKFFRLRPEIIDYKGRLLLGSNLQIDQKSRDILREAVINTFFITPVHTSEEIYRLLLKKFSPLLNSLFINNSYGLFSVLRYLYPNDFLYVRPQIALLGQTITKPLESINNYLNGRYKTSIKELKEFIDDTGYDINLSLSFINKLPDIIMIDHDTLAPRTRLEISKEQLQEIANLIVDELNETPKSNATKAIRDLSCAARFPILNMQLNEWILYSILTKWNWPEKDGELALFTYATSPHLGRNIPIVSTNETIDKETRQAIASAHERKGSIVMSVDDLSNLDELIEDEIEYDWDLDALEEEEEDNS